MVGTGPSGPVGMHQVRKGWEGGIGFVAGTGETSGGEGGVWAEDAKAEGIRPAGMGYEMVEVFMPRFKWTWESVPEKMGG